MLSLTNLAAAAKPAPAAPKVQQLNKAPAKKNTSTKVDLASLWGGAAGFGGRVFGEGPVGPMAPGFGVEAGFAAPFGARDYMGYGPANYVDANVASRDRYAAAGGYANAQWDGAVAGRDSMNARRYQAASMAAGQQSAWDTEAAWADRKAESKAQYIADTEAAAAAFAARNAEDAYQIAATDDSVARENAQAAQNARMVRDQALELAHNAEIAEAQAVENMRRAEAAEAAALAESRANQEASMRARNQQAQAFNVARSDSYAAAQNNWAAANAFGASNQYGLDANMNWNAASNARGAEFAQQSWANNNAWAGNRAAIAANTPQYFGAGYGMW